MRLKKQCRIGLWIGIVSLSAVILAGSYCGTSSEKSVWQEGQAMAWWSVLYPGGEEKEQPRSPRFWIWEQLKGLFTSDQTVSAFVDQTPRFYLKLADKQSKM